MFLAMTGAVDIGQRRANEALMRQAIVESGTVDWQRCRSMNERVCAWLNVEGTAISQPVAHPEREEGSFYLDHDVFGRPSAAGAVYLDALCSPSDPLLVVYGHRMGNSTEMFSELGEYHEQERFDALGTASWSTPEGTDTFEPVCALVVDEQWNGLDAGAAASRRPNAKDGLPPLNAWLTALLGRANASSGKSDALCASAQRALVLVTCSSPIAGGPERTVTVFASTG